MNRYTLASFVLSAIAIACSTTSISQVFKTPDGARYTVTSLINTMREL
jgi:hypothetical protein